jgi:hypothetical protein
MQGLFDIPRLKETIYFRGESPIEQFLLPNDRVKMQMMAATDFQISASSQTSRLVPALSHAGLHSSHRLKVSISQQQQKPQVCRSDHGLNLEPFE